ncbi:MAG TPA: hypothetical protein VFR85_04175 [Anaeromyxobacteraceae bacterium]|nr:hypothetical protein [Anaeromyxobacteraceae bacterium]
MLRFTCSDCGKRFSTTDDPAPGQVYRIQCRCGKSIVLQGEPGGAVPPPLPAASRRSTPTEPLRLQLDDPFVRAAMDSPWQAPPDEEATTPGGPLARRDPDQAEQDAAPEAFFSYDGDDPLPDITRPRRLAGTHAWVLDASVSLREAVGGGVRRFWRSRWLVAGGAVLGSMAFAAGVWVGAESTAARGKVRAATGAEARSGTAEPSPGTLAALVPAAMPESSAAPVPVVAGNGQRSLPGPANVRQATGLRERVSHAPVAVRPAPGPTAAAAPKVESIASPVPAAAGGPASMGAPSPEEATAPAEPRVDATEAGKPGPAPDQAPRAASDSAADRLPDGRQAMASPPERREAEAAGGSALAASPHRGPTLEGSAEAKPAAAKPADAPPVK